MTRTYDQQCPIAKALDVIGDRWALLVVRELMLGPLRFGEIADGLVGVGSRQLTERLKALVDQGVIEAVALSPGPHAAGYALTPRGRALAPTLSALAAWGLEAWMAAPEGAATPTSVALMLWSRAARDGPTLRLLSEVEVDRTPFRFAFTDAGVLAWRGRDGGEPTALLRLRSEDALALLSGRLALPEAVRRQRMAAEGPDANEVARLLFGSPLQS